MERKEISGPWKYTGEHTADCGGRFYEIVDANGDAVVGEYGGPGDLHQAHLIAAAPCLLEALELTLRALERTKISGDYVPVLERNCIAKGRAAIARATGETR